MPLKLLCKIYRSPRKEGMYLYVAADKGLAEVPETLLKQFGEPQEAMTLLLTPERTLASADPADVAARIESDGYYLQLPPLPGADMQALSMRNDKLPR